jgi:hypothetical protein
MTMKSRLLPSWYLLTQNAIRLLESSPFLEGNYFNKWFLYYISINHTPIDYYVYTLYMVMAMQSRHFTFWYPLTPYAVGLLESSPLLEGNYFYNWLLYYFNINYSPLDYYIHTLYLMMGIQSRLLSSWYPLNPDAVGLLESYPFLEDNYFNNTVCYNILVIIIVKYIILVLPCIRRWQCKAGFFLFDTPWPLMPLDCWNLLHFWKAIILKNGSYIIIISITFR